MMQFYFFNFGVTMSTSPDFFWGADSIMMLPYFNKSLEAEPSGAFFGRYKIFDKYYIAIVANFSTNINIYTSKIYKGSYQTIHCYRWSACACKERVNLAHCNVLIREAHKYKCHLNCIRLLARPAQFPLPSLSSSP